MQHKFPSIISVAEGLASSATIVGAFSLSTQSLPLLAGYATLLAGSLTALGLALHRRDKGVLARQVILASIHGWAILSGGA